MIITITPATEATADTEATEALVIDLTDVEALTVAYQAASTGSKTKIRNAVQAAMHEAVRNMDMAAAQLAMAATEAIKGLATTKSVEIDFNQVLADRIIGLTYAAHRLTYGDVTPAGLDADKIDMDKVRELVDAYRASGDLDAVSDTQAAIGNKLAGTKITRSAAARGSVEAYIESAVAGLPVGSTLTISQLRTRSGAPSDGALAARLYPRNDGKVTLDMVALGIELADVDGTRGVRITRATEATDEA